MLTVENSLTLVIDFQTRMIPSINKNDELTKKAAVFIEGCRILGVPMLVTQQYTKGLGETIPEVAAALGEFEPVEKITFSCCADAGFREKLEATRRKNIIVTGIEAHICVQQTVLELLTAGYSVYVLADCIGSRSETDKIYAEKRMRQAGAVITTMESVLFELLVRADNPQRKEISSLVK